MISLQGKVSLITGASRGIGRATAVLFASAGSDVIINYNSDQKSAEAVQQECLKHGVRAITYAADVADSDAVNKMIASVIAEFGRLDILVNNAGVWEQNDIASMNLPRLRRAVDINLYGTIYPTMAVVPHMIAQKSGSIINISSTAGQRGEAFHSPYSATKSAVIGLTKSWAPELARHGIRVNCVAPGWVDTDMSRDVLVSAEGDNVRAQIPLGRAGTADELAGPILFLASDLATFITGEILNVNGGAVLCG